MQRNKGTPYPYALAMIPCLAGATAAIGACSTAKNDATTSATSGTRADVVGASENVLLDSHRTADGGAGGDSQGESNGCTFVDLQSILPGGAHEDPDIARVNAEIDSTEGNALAQASSASSLDTYHRMSLLGTVELYDKNLSVFGNVACTTCHVPEAGYTGGSSLLNQTTVAQPGSVAITNATDEHPNYRLSNRKPQSYTYAPFSPILHYNATQGAFYGGNFWDFRATGTRLGNPAAEQAEGPPLNPLEMGNSDSACVVYRIATGKYRSLFELVWGQYSFAIQWPSDVEQVCNRPGPPPSSDPLQIGRAHV